MPLSGSPKEIVGQEMHRFKRGQLHSGSHHGPIVHNAKQAIAIALSEARRAKRQFGGALGLPVIGARGSAPSNFNFMGAGSSPTTLTQTAPSVAPAPNVTPAPIPSNQPPSAAMPTPAASPATSPAVMYTEGNPSPQPVANLGNLFGGFQPQQGTFQGFSPQMMQFANAIMAARPNQFGGQGGGQGWWGNLFSAFSNPAIRGRGYAFGGLTKPPSPSWTVRNEARSMLHSGPISSAVPGRTDRHNVSVGSGAYVLPADHVSALGQNNTKAGHAVLNAMFGAGGPYGVKAMGLKHGAGAPKPPGLPKMGAAPKLPKVSAGGGKGEHRGHPVPIVVAGGEYTIPPHIVEAIGDGDIKRGHKILDDWVLSTRKKHVKTLQKLPGPAKA